MNVFVYGGMIGGVLLLDLLLSGDNVLVIGVAAAGLERRQRWYAIGIGGLVAMLLRILFTALASVLLNIPFIQTIGAVILLYLAQKLLKDRSQNGLEGSPQEEVSAIRGGILKRFTSTHSAFLSALLTILIADVTMSLDNILAVGALSNGEIIPLIIGLVGSITVLLLGSAIVSVMVEKLGWILDLAAVVLGWTSATMFHDDVLNLAKSFPWLNFLIPLGKTTLPLNLSWLMLMLGVICCGIVIALDIFYRYKTVKKTRLKKEE